MVSAARVVLLWSPTYLVVGITGKGDLFGAVVPFDRIPHNMSRNVLRRPTVQVEPDQDLQEGSVSSAQTLGRNSSLTSSRRKSDRQLGKSNSGLVRLLAIAMTADVSNPSTPVGVIKCCMFGVNRKGTCSVQRCSGSC